MLRCLLALAMMVTGTLAIDRATAHAAVGGLQAAPPCHGAAHHAVHYADGLTQKPVNACDTICAGSAPESSYETLPPRIDAPMPAMVFAPQVATALIMRAAPPPARYGHGPPPPQPAYLRNGRLLI